MTTYHDGQIIKLPLGWTIHCDASTRENEECQGFVFSPKGKESASLNFALDCGTTSNGTEMEIPKEVMSELEKYEDDLS